jgi:hypothetical protein
MLVATNFSCSNDDDSGSVTPTAPSTYAFERNGVSTVSYGGQTTRLNQADELYAALNSKNLDNSPRTFTEQELDLMFGGDDSGFSAGFANGALNGTTKLIRSKTSAMSNSATNRPIFDGWITDFSENVVPNFTGTASDGTAGEIRTGDSYYQVNAQGQELDQLFFKSLIGAFALDQIINNYITPSQLDSGTRRDENTAGTLEEGDPYTTMEHKWDEGFGYLYGQVADVTMNFGLPANGEATGNLLMKYFKKVEEIYEPGIAETVYNAFIAGRHAITISDYDARDAAATIIKTELSKVIGYYSINYLKDYIVKAGEGNAAKAHHSLSEAYGFMFSLQFTNDGGDAPYMDNATVSYVLDNYFNNFHQQQDVYINAPGQGMIDQINTAFGNLNIE